MIKLVGVFFLFMLLVATLWFFVRENKKLALKIIGYGTLFAALATVVLGFIVVAF